MKLTAIKLLEQLLDLLLNLGGDARLMNLAFNFLSDTKQECVSDAIMRRASWGGRCTDAVSNLLFYPFRNMTVYFLYFFGDLITM